MHFMLYYIGRLFLDSEERYGVHKVYFRIIDSDPGGGFHDNHIQKTDGGI